ncbi:MAG: RHS repeat-associated core domain-containing protein, partial [Bryobacteraceae bacterium]
YGEEKVPNGVDGWKFATYLRDTGTNLDYADQRFYANTQGRFLSADPYAASGGAGDPGSWNRYGYVQGDPVNFRDSRGLFVENTSGCGAPDTDYCIDDGYSAGGGGGGGCWVDTFNPLPGPVCTFFSVPYTPVATPAPAPLRPASIRIEKASDGTQRDCYTSLQDTNAGSLAERDILYGVYDQNGDFMSGVIIRELLTLFDGNCPNGTQQVGNQCIGSYNKPGGYFLDSLSASPGTSGSKFDQIFQVTTLPSVAGYQGVYNLGLRIENNYTSSGSGSNALVVTPGVITVNNNNGGFRRCTGGRP